MRRIPLFVIAFLALALTPLPALAASQASPPAASPVVVPATPVGDQLAWLLPNLRGGAEDLSIEEFSGHVAPEFLEVVPAEQMLSQIWFFAAGLGDFTFAGFTRTPLDTQANALLIDSGGTPWVVAISVEAEAPYLITGLNVGPVPAPAGVELTPAALPDGTPVDDPERLEGFFDVGDGRQIYLSCVGTGSPIVILESGLGDPAALWFGVESAVAQTTRVCSYDRPGTAGGASDPAPGPRTGEDVATDLHALLQAADIPGPYILVGHSIGGIFARQYAHAYPDEVAGLVFVDSSHEDQQVRLMEILTPELQEMYEQLIAMSPNPENIDLEGSLDLLRATRESGSFPEVPLVVVTAGYRGDPAAFPPGWSMDEEKALWLELQADIASLAPDGRHLVAEDSSHYVHQSNPDIVVDAIEQVIAGARDPDTWATPTASPAA
ncbi:MAG TPA: alpha/beta fold hydrolase [Thermomicrobiales bacterium]|nr:alpha/beta fold hydrolase [Thermomicrobiales bacterium]